MTAEEARALVAAVRAGRALEVKWEGADAHCFLTVRYEAGQGLTGHWDEIPFDVLSPWRDVETRTWSEDELVAFLAGLRAGTAYLTG
jgi:hypothetical protein